MYNIKTFKMEVLCVFRSHLVKRFSKTINVTNLLISTWHFALLIINIRKHEN